MASELPDLEWLELSRVTWDSLRTEVLRRRPRTNRNRLRYVWFTDCSVTGVESPSFAFAAWTLVLGVSHPSPLDSLDATHALVRTLYRHSSCIVKVERDQCKGRVSGLRESFLVFISVPRHRSQISGVMPYDTDVLLRHCLSLPAGTTTSL